jgi:hypothetical protein
MKAVSVYFVLRVIDFVQESKLVLLLMVLHLEKLPNTSKIVSTGILCEIKNVVRERGTFA